MTSTTTRELRYREAINEAIIQEMERDPDVIIMGEEIAGGAGREHLGIVDAWGGAFKTTVGLIQKFGSQRVKDTPLSEAAFVGTAIGAASTGLRPIAELMFVDFVGVCMDQILNNAAKMRYMYGGQVKVPFTLLTRIGAGTGSAAQHSESFYSIFSHIPGIKGVVPCDPYTAKGLLISAIRDDDPVVFFEHKLLYPETGPVPEEPYCHPPGEGPHRQARHGHHPGGHLQDDPGVPGGCPEAPGRRGERRSRGFDEHIPHRLRPCPGLGKAHPSPGRGG